jgi:hypothetical protein
VWRATCARTIALGVMLALSPLPAAAAEATASAPRSIDLAAAIKRFAASERLAQAAPATPPADAANRSDLQSPSFFRTPLGLAVIAVVGAGSAYAIYSAQHDRIHSQAR